MGRPDVVLHIRTIGQRNRDRIAFNRRDLVPDRSNERNRGRESGRKFFRRQAGYFLVKISSITFE